jgi:glycosyltransferase involved in cell wall biosynthesis
MESQDRAGLRILYHHRIAAADGMRVHITELVHALRQAGHVVHIVGPSGAETPAQPPSAGGLERAADTLRKLLPASAFELLELAYNIPAYLRLRRAAKTFKPDVLYERYNLYLLAGLFLRQRKHLPMILEVNSPLAAERAEFGHLKLKRIAGRCERSLWRGADAALPVTDVLADQVRLARGTADGVHVVHNGANLDQRPDPAAVAAVRARYGLNEDMIVLGFVGFVRAWHGVGWAIEALPELPERTHLLIVGDGPARAELEARAEALGVGHRVHFSGRVPHDAVPAHMQCFDIALQTAAVAYASPLKLFEYMALGRAIVAPDQPNIREVLSDGDNALLFTPDSADSFRAALHSLCRDDSLRARLGEAAYRTVIETPFTWAHNAARIEAMARAML